MRTLTQGPYSTVSAIKGIGCTLYATDRGVGEITNKPLAVTRELLTSHQQCSRYIFLQPPDILSSPINTKDNKLRADTLEPPYNEGPRDWQNMFVIMRIRYIRVLFHIIILLLLEKRISFVIPQTSLYKDSNNIDVPLYCVITFCITT